MYFAGVDLHKRYLTLCILDPQRNVLREHRRLGTDALFAVLAEFDEPISLAVEATLHWAWLHDESDRRNRRRQPFVMRRSVPVHAGTA